MSTTTAPSPDLPATQAATHPGLGGTPPHAPAGGPPQPRRRRPGPTALAVLLAVAVIALVALRPLESRRDPAPTWLTEPVRTTTLAEAVTADAVVAFDDEAVRTVLTPRPGTVTGTTLVEGAHPTPLEPVAHIDGAPVAWVPAEAPLHRDLAEGDEGDDVEALEQALADGGHDPGDVDGTYDAETAEAVRSWQADLEVTETGAVALADVVSFPAGTVVVEPGAGVGAVVSPGQPLATVAAPAALHVAAAVEGGDIATVAEGDVVAVRLDGADDAVEGTVASIAVRAREDGRFVVEVAVPGLPDLARAGQEAEVEVTVATIPDALVVPLAALQGSGSDPQVQVLVDGAPEDRSIDIGLVTTDGAEVTAGLAEGDLVVIGQATPTDATDDEVAEDQR